LAAITALPDEILKRHLKGCLIENMKKSKLPIDTNAIDEIIKTIIENKTRLGSINDYLKSFCHAESPHWLIQLYLSVADAVSNDSYHALYDDPAFCKLESKACKTLKSDFAQLTQEKALNQKPDEST